MATIQDKRRCNQLALISHLPADPLCLIFKHLQNHPRSKNDECNLSEGYDLCLRWIPEVTHVCHSWREIALETATLWTDVNVDASLSWAAEFGRRSKNAAIAVIVDFNRTALECVMQLLRENVQRVQKLELNGLDPEHFHIIFSFGSVRVDDRAVMQWPALQDFVLGFKYKSGETSFLITDPMPDAPALKKLVLKYCFIDWKAFGLLQNLSELHIIWVPFGTLAGKAIYEALLHMPNLEVLKLIAIVIPPERLPLMIATPGQLPIRLRMIDCGPFPVTWLSSILDGIIYAQRDLVIRFVPDVLHFEKVSSVFNCFLCHIEKSSIRYAELKAGILRNSSLFFFRARRTTSNSKISQPTDSNFTILPPIGFDHLLDLWVLTALLERLFLRLDLQNLEILSISLPFQLLSINTWVDVFYGLPNLLPNLHTLRFVADSWKLLAALVVVPHGPDHAPDHASLTTRPTIPFENLQTIVIQRNTPFTSEDNHLIFSCLRRRLDMGAPIKKPHIRLYGENHALDVDTLREVVQSVDVEY